MRQVSRKAADGALLTDGGDVSVPACSDREPRRDTLPSRNVRLPGRDAADIRPQTLAAFPDNPEAGADTSRHARDRAREDLHRRTKRGPSDLADRADRALIEVVEDALQIRPDFDNQRPFVLEINITHGVDHV